MAVSIKKMENSVAEITLNEQGEKLQQYKKKVVSDLGKNVEVPGFRKGKVPVDVVEKRLEGAIKEELADKLLKEHQKEIFESGEIQPVDYVKLKKVDLDDNSIEVVFNVDIYPDVKLGEYKGIEVEKEKFEMSDDKLEKEIELLIEKNSKLKEVEEGAAIENEDTANINFEGFIDGEAFEGGKAENYDLKIGSKSFIDNFEDQLIGKKAGEELEVNVNFPQEYFKEDYAGKPAMFKVKINSIKRLEKPELNDDFAKDLGFENVAELREKKTKEIEERETSKIENELKNKLVDKVRDASELNIPKSMIDREINHRIMELERQLKAQGMTLDLYLQMNKLDKASIYQELAPMAETRIKTDIVLDKIAELEDIKVDDEELDTVAKEVAQGYGMEIDQLKEKLKSMGTYDNFIANLKVEKSTQKTINFLVDSAKIV
jgi:trigger factor